MTGEKICFKKKTIFFLKVATPTWFLDFVVYPRAVVQCCLVELCWNSTVKPTGIGKKEKKSRPISSFSRYRRRSTYNGVYPWKNSKMGATENAVVVVVDVFFLHFFFLYLLILTAFLLLLLFYRLSTTWRPTRLATTYIIPVFGTHHTDGFSEFRTVDGDFFPYHSFPPYPSSLFLNFFFYLSVFLLLPPPMHRCTLHGDDLARALCHRIINF